MWIINKEIKKISIIANLSKEHWVKLEIINKRSYNYEIIRLTYFGKDTIKIRQIQKFIMIYYSFLKTKILFKSLDQSNFFNL